MADARKALNAEDGGGRRGSSASIASSELKAFHGAFDSPDSETMEYGLLDGPSTLQVLRHDPFEKLRSDVAVPDAFRIHDDDRTTPAHAEAGRFATLHASRTEEQSFALEKAGQLRIQRATAAIGRTEPSRAHQHVPAVRFEERFVLRHAQSLTSLLSPGGATYRSDSTGL